MSIWCARIAVVCICCAIFSCARQVIYPIGSLESVSQLCMRTSLDEFSKTRDPKNWDPISGPEMPDVTVMQDCMEKSWPLLEEVELTDAESDE